MLSIANLKAPVIEAILYVKVPVLDGFI